MKTHWELESNGRTSVLDVNESEVCVGSTCGPAGSMVGNVVSHAEFLDGRYHEVVLKIFGQETLNEMIAAVNSHDGATPAG
jgi:hypothetical protein